MTFKSVVKVRPFISALIKILFLHVQFLLNIFVRFEVQNKCSLNTITHAQGLLIKLYRQVRTEEHNYLIISLHFFSIIYSQIKNYSDTRCTFRFLFLFL